MRTLLISIILLVLLSNVCITSIRTEAQTETLSDTLKLKDYLKTTYMKLQDAEKKGANVTLAAQKLDRALQILDQVKGNQSSSDNVLLSQAASIIDDTDKSIPYLIAEGENRALWINIGTVLTMIFVIIVCLLVYLYLPRLIWSTWAKYRANWKVKPI